MSDGVKKLLGRIDWPAVVGGALFVTAVSLPYLPAALKIAHPFFPHRHRSLSLNCSYVTAPGHFSDNSRMVQITLCGHHRQDMMTWLA
jgi:hypothetical protein